ncbi:DNA methyltransferase, partial [Limosilactobacillus fermentum]
MQTDNEKYNETVRPNTAFLNELKDKLPEFFTKDGSFDLNKFRTQLKEKNVDELSEGYQLDFIGKDYARRQAGEMPTTVIVPDEKQNQGEGKNSKNLFFTGDNLEVLRHLQNNYQNKIDVIYIDPPYNTGSDGFVYPDNFEYSDEKLKDMFGLDDDQVERLKSIQGKSSHSAWLAFMYPRLAMAKKLLAKDGVIFISIDDNEMADLKIMMDELYGEKQLIGNIAWESKTKSQNTATSYDKLQPKVEYILAYSKYGHSHFH